MTEPNAGGETRRRVVVTGLGALTPVGLDAESSWRAVVEGRSGIRALSGPEFANLAVRIGGWPEPFDPLDYLSKVDARRLDPHVWYAVAAADEATRDWRRAAADGDVDPGSLAVLAGTAAGAVRTLYEGALALDRHGPRRVPPGVVVAGGADAAAAHLSQRYGALGGAAGIGATCASGAVAIGEGMRRIRHGYADAVLVVGADDCLTPVNLAGNGNIRALTSAWNDEPAAASRPFDVRRSGFVMSSGAAAILLEAEDHAARRSARVLGEVVGFGAASDAYHATAPHPEGRGARIAMQQAFRDARVEPGDIDYVNAHGTSTELNDRLEIQVLREVLGERAEGIPVSSTKSTTGHLLGAAGVFEAIVSLLAIRDGVAPPTINLDESEFPAFNLVANRSQPAGIETVLSNSFGFGGHNASLVLRGPAREGPLQI